MRHDRLAGVYAVAVGLAMIAMWTGLFLAGEIPDLASAPVEIGFHLVAEGLTAAALLLSGMGLYRGWPRAQRGLLVALGMLLYTVINSAGYYAGLGEWPMVGMFAVLTVATLAFLGSAVIGWPRSDTPRRGWQA